MQPAADIVIVGAGAAGMMAALAARGAVDERGLPQPPSVDAPTVLVLDGSPKVGLKILVSGGGRCNVTNEAVTELDFDTDAPHLVRGLLRGFPAASARAFFESRGCPLYVEPLGKLFPTSDRASDVLEVLRLELERAGVTLRTGAEVTALEPTGSSGWRCTLRDGSAVQAPRVVLATGGKSLPRTGSRGFGCEALAALGHELEPTLPALTPIRLGEPSPLHGLAGITVPALLSLVPRDCHEEQVCGLRFRPLARAAGSLLITHLGVSGPAALDVSGASARLLAANLDARLLADFWTLVHPSSPFWPFLDAPKLPGACLSPQATPRPWTAERFLGQVRQIIDSGRQNLLNSLARGLPRTLVGALLQAADLDPTLLPRALDQPQWLRVYRALVHAELPLAGVDGFEKAEVTRGGVRLAELDRRTLESKRCRGLFVCGEVVNCTGRLGGFNFQWAWSSGFAAGRGARSPARPGA